MADALLTDLLKRLGSFAAQQALQELQLLVGVDEEVQKLEDNLKIIEAVLDDAEERQMKMRTEKLWLEQLQDIFYWMDDVLDSWNTASIKLKIQKEEEEEEEEEEEAADSKAPALKKKVWSFFPSPSCCFGQADNLSLRHEIGHKIQKLNQTFDKILNHRVAFGIDLNRKPKVDERPPTTSFVDVSKIFGRDKYRDSPLNNLLGVGSQEESNPLVISLVGTGGIGKSTLAQLAYNHREVQAYFHKTMWVCVSDPFDQYKVAKAIIQELDSKHESLKNTTSTLNSLLHIVSYLIRGKKFFLVLDDVWAKDSTKESEKWEPLKNALICGAQGSRILVTTRNEEVAQMMGSAKAHIINLEELSPNDCWAIIWNIAFFGDNHNLGQHKDLEDLGIQLGKKCKGLPLAAKTLGNHMRGKKNKVEWEMALQSSLWELEGSGKGLLGPLMLSYYELSPAEKQCFLYCSVFPKDHPFNRLELVIHWMAQGYIDSKVVDMKKEVIAEDYFKNLAMRSFFQDFEQDESDGRILRCKMHDIVHDFAQSMTKDVCFTINSDDKVEKDFKRARQLSLVVKDTFPKSIYDAKNLRFLNLDLLSSQTVPPQLFENFTCLRTLHLKGETIMKLPNEVGNLIHLRYLKLSCFSITELSETICNLCNLQSFDVSECSRLQKLPLGMGKLINLRHVCLPRESMVFPKGIGKLTCLRTLSDFKIGGKDDKEGCKLGELKNLNQLQGTFRIHVLRNVVDVGEAENAQLKRKMHLCSLELDFGFIGEREVEEEEERRRMENDELVLNALEPHSDLKSLTIIYYRGTKVSPNWMMSLTSLKLLFLKYCYNLEYLPPLGKLQFLELLVIKRANNVKSVGDEFLGIESKNKNNKDIFPKLKSLEFRGLVNWEEWIGMRATREEEEKKDEGFVPIKIMPLLESLSITGCSKLKSLPDFLPTIPLHELQIRRCPVLEPRCKPMKGRDRPKISQSQSLKLKSLFGLSKSH